MRFSCRSSLQIHILMTIASVATEPPASQSGQGGGVIISGGGGCRIAPSLALITTLSTLISISCHGPTCPNRRMRPNTIEILLTWPVGLALTTTCSPERDVTPYLFECIRDYLGGMDRCVRTPAPETPFPRQE